MDFFQQEAPFSLHAIEAVQRMLAAGQMQPPQDNGMHPALQLAGASNVHKLRAVAHAKLIAQAMQHLRTIRQH